MSRVDSLGSNQDCRIGNKNSNNRVSQCLASIRKLGNRRNSEGLRSFKSSKGTNLFILIILAGKIEMNPDIKSEMRSFKSNENIHKKEGGSYYVLSANKASSVTL